jgi:hypothetical protein
MSRILAWPTKVTSNKPSPEVVPLHLFTTAVARLEFERSGPTLQQAVRF